jgi:hypothetical protein
MLKIFSAIDRTVLHRKWRYYVVQKGHAVAQWLRQCDTNRKVAGSIPDGVTGIFH